MRAVRDLLVTGGVLLVLFAGLAALPFLILLIIMGGAGFLIYAYIHDQRIVTEERKDTDI